MESTTGKDLAMKRIRGLLTGLAASLLFCACGAGDEESTHTGDSDDIFTPAPAEDGASDQAEAAQSGAGLDSDGQTAAVVLACTNACTAISTVNLTGVCCVQRTFVRAVFNRNTYLCK
jgi:hypothetical protein